MPPPEPTVIELPRRPNWRRRAVIRLAASVGYAVCLVGALLVIGDAPPWWAIALIVALFAFVDAEMAAPAWLELRHPPGRLELRIDELVVHNPAVLRRPLHIPKGDIREIVAPGTMTSTFGAGGTAKAERGVWVSVRGREPNTLIRLRRARAVPEVRQLAIPRQHRRTKRYVASSLWCTLSPDDGQRLARWLRTRR